MRRRRPPRGTLVAVALALLVVLPAAAPASAPGVEAGTVDASGGMVAPDHENGTAGGMASVGSSESGERRPARSADGELPEPVTHEPTDSPDGRTGNPSAGGTVEQADPVHRVTLVTGERVVLSRAGGSLSIQSVVGGPVDLVETSRGTYLLPRGVDLSTYDRSLFEVETLLERRDEGTPVMLDANASVAALERAGLRDVRRLPSAGVVAAVLHQGASNATVEALVADGRVERVSLDRPLDRPPEPVAAPAARARDLDVTGEGVTVAVLDTGIDATHPDLADRVVDRVDLVGAAAGDEGGDGRDQPLDPQGHGTHVAGVVAGSGAASEGTLYSGVAPGADLIDVRVMDERGRGRASTIIEGIEYAVDAGADVMLLSLGTSIDGSASIAESVRWATGQGVVVVAAAGNDGRPRTIGAPGRPTGAITVGATDGTGRVAPYSSRGPTLDGGLKPDLVAPSDGVVGPRADGAGRFPVDDDGDYTRLTGTSAAAPQVAGAAALLLAAEPGLTAREIENRLASTARPVAGSSVYAQGGGELAIERALDPDVVAGDAVVDFGLVQSNGTRDRTVELVNHGDRRHELRLETTVRNVDLDRPAEGVAWLNRTSLSLEPGERARVRLTVDGNATPGAHAGTIRYAVGGEPRNVAFGFVRGGAVTVEKRPLSPGDLVDGDELWVLTEESTHDELLEFEDGNASFVAGGGTYLLWSTGYDDVSDTTVFLSERRRFDGPEHVVLDEADTVPVGVDVGPLVDRYGRLQNRSVAVSMSAPYAGGVVKRSVSRMNVDGRAVRVSPDPDLAVATTFLLAAGGGRREDLDVADVFTLAHGADGVTGPSVVEVTPAKLATSRYRYHRTTVDETYRAQDRVTLPDVWNQRTSRWFDLGLRTDQRLHRLQGAASYERVLQGDGWTARRGVPGKAAGPVDVLAHPLVGVLEVGYGAGGVTVSGTPFADGTGTRFAPPGTQTVEVEVDGTVVTERLVRGGSRTLDPVAVGHDEAITVRLRGNNSDGHLSTSTLTEVHLPPGSRPAPGKLSVPDRPPTITDVTVPAAGVTNAVPPGEFRVTVDVDHVGVSAEPVVWYAAGTPTEPPWENESGWVRASVERERGRLVATAHADADAGRVSLAAAVGDIWGRRTRTVTVGGVHVGEAPDTSTSFVGGRLVAHDGTPAANDTVVLQPVEDGSTRYVQTDRRGSFSVEVPRSKRYDLTYFRDEPWFPGPPAAGQRPAWHPLGRVDADEGADLGVRTMPRARRVTVNVTDERGDPVAGATVRVTQRDPDRTLRTVLETDRKGRARRPVSGVPGVELAGPVEVTVTAPEADVYPDQEHVLEVETDGPGSLEVTLETTPPEALLSAFGTFEPGDPVFLHARRSEVPAGAAMYRWDLDGDGEADRVTDDPIVRYVPDERTRRPTVTVVDEAGKTDTSTLVLSVESG